MFAGKSKSVSHNSSTTKINHNKKNFKKIEKNG